jgi:hypothetical protein
MAQDKRVSKGLASVLIAIILGLVAVTIYLSGFPKNQPPTTLYPSEVNNYQGENLSTVASVYENAIKGTQYINASPTA